MTEFKVNEIVQVGGEKGKIIEITKPLGTYPIYKVHMMGNGEIRSAARHELVKGMPDEDFQNLFDCFEQARATGTISLLDLLNENTLSNVNASDLGPELFETNVQEDTTVPSPPHPIIVNNVNNHAIKNSRFVQLPISPTEFILEKENKRTKAKTTSHIKLITQFLLSKEETRPIEIIPPADLNTYLMEFLLCVRQTNGSEYEPSTLRNMISSFDRHLKDHGYETTITKGDAFSQTMKVFYSKAKDLKMKGMGNKPKAAAPATDVEIETLYTNGQLGSHTPGALINTMWLNNTLHFGMRGGGAEHRQLLWGDVTLHNDTDLATEYLEHNERQTKTRTGIDLNNIRREKPRVYATYTETCPVAIYKAYSDHRPDQFSGPETPFYLAPVTHNLNPGPNQQWFLKQAVGVNKLSTLMSTMAKKAALPEINEGKRITNTSIRKRLCQKLLSANVPDTHAIHITGHKSADSLNHYRTLTNHQQKNISNILSNTVNSHNQTGQGTHNQTGQITHNQTGQVTHNQTGQVAHNQTGQVTHNQTGQITYNQTGQVTHNQTGQNQTGQVTHNQTGQTSQNQAGLSLHSQTNSSKSSEARVISGLFRNATINGGTFNITIVGQKRKRQEMTDSDEECVIASQDF